MNRAVLVIAVALLGAAILATPLVSAVPLKEKSNDKFESFHVDFLVNIVTFLQGEHNFIPSMDNVNILTIDGPEAFISYNITVGSKTYHMGEDFIYMGHFEYTFYDVTAWLTIPNVLPPYVWPSQYRARHFMVDYMYEFLPASGIESAPAGAGQPAPYQTLPASGQEEGGGIAGTIWIIPAGILAIVAGTLFT